MKPVLTPVWRNSFLNKKPFFRLAFSSVLSADRKKLFFQTVIFVSFVRVIFKFIAMANKKAPSNSFTDSLLSESQNFSEPEDDVIHPQEDLQGYDSIYDVKLNKENKPFFCWNEKAEQRVDLHSDWKALFEAKPYIEYLPNQYGVLFPIIHIIANKSSLVIDETKRQQAYHDFLNRLGLEEQQALLPTISHFHNYRQLALDQLKRGLTQLEKIDCDVQSVLKVLYYESTTKGIDIGGLVEHLYKIIIRNVCKYQSAKSQPLLESLKAHQIDNIILESAGNGLLHYIEKKETIIRPLVPVYEKYLFLEIAIQQVLNNEEVSEANLTVLDIQKPKREVTPNSKRLEMEHKAQENKEKREQVILTAKNIIDEGKPEQFFGDKGWPKKILWDHIKLKTQTFYVPEATRKNWLKNAYLSGIFSTPANE